ncbi:hypothetical protein GH733_009016 [Mirounga leonina]|nr:hypothetical protein GH733_009016 [Mirounga leonina]
MVVDELIHGESESLEVRLRTETSSSTDLTKSCDYGDGLPDAENCTYRDASGESCDEFRLKICYFMRYWILKFPAEFNLDLGLIRMTEEFREVASQLGYEKHISLIDISSIPSYDWMRRVTQRKKVSKKGKACLLFDHLEPIELAEHLTFLEHKSFRRISNWHEMTELVSSSGNYCCYRRAFADCEGFKIPILGVHLKDLIAVHVIFPDWTEDNKVNIVKMHQLSVTLSELVSLQNASHHLEPNMDLINLLTLSLDLYHTEDDIYKLSLVLEPRNSKSVGGVFSKDQWQTPLFVIYQYSVIAQESAEVNENSPLAAADFDVMSVFRNYDHDHDGYISQEDFESIAANFPFLDSFCVLDKDQDGLISKDEMMAYFLRAKSQLHCKMGPGFVHNFQEMTYLKPTFCEHCAGFLWGIIKQGYKCKVQDEVFEFPGVTAGHRDLDSRAITLVTGSSRKISVRLQRATTSQATQTEPVWSEAGWGDSGSHTFPKMKSKFHDKAAKDKGFAKWENEKPRVQAGVDVVDRGTEFEPDQDEADVGETRQDGKAMNSIQRNDLQIYYLESDDVYESYE